MRGEESPRGTDDATAQGIGKSLHKAFTPDAAADVTFDRLIEQLDAVWPPSGKETKQ